MKLALGTVQFGTLYGSFNDSGRPTIDEVARILDRAGRAGISILDTARGYGESEAVLGALGAVDRFSIVTKVTGLAGAAPDAVDRSIDESLAALRTDRLAGLMLHAAGDLLGGQGDAYWRRLEAARSDGKTARIGVSVYHPAEARAILDRYPIGIIQLPANIVDQRFARAGILDICQARGVEVHVRSAFLQGFLLTQPEALTGSLTAYRPVLEKVIAHARHRDVSRLALALAPLLKDDRIGAVLVGVDSLRQLDEIIAAARDADTIAGPFDALAVTNEDLLNPGLWTS